MRTLFKASLAVMLSALATISVQAQGVTVYQSDIFYTSGIPSVEQLTSGQETGDQITLAGTSRFITGFSFDYYATGLDANATAKVKFYDNTGLNGAPKNVLFDSGAFAVANSPTGTRLTFTTSDLGGGFQGATEMTWTVTALYSTGSFGLYGASTMPTIGGNYSDAWVYKNGAWSLVVNPNFAQGSLNFSGSLTAVPEPSTLALLGVGSMFGLFMVRRRN